MIQQVHKYVRNSCGGMIKLGAFFQVGIVAVNVIGDPLDKPRTFSDTVSSTLSSSFLLISLNLAEPFCFGLFYWE